MAASSGRHSASNASVACAIDTSTITGHIHASLSGIPERTAKSRNASNDKTNAKTARSPVDVSANRKVTFDRRPLRTSRDNPSIESIKMIGGATATPAANGAGTARSVATSECAALPAIDAELAMIRTVQKNHFARRWCRRASTSSTSRPGAVNESVMGLIILGIKQFRPTPAPHPPEYGSKWIGVGACTVGYMRCPATAIPPPLRVAPGRVGIPALHGKYHRRELNAVGQVLQPVSHVR